MNQHKSAFALAWIAALLVAAPAVAQLPFSPVLGLPAGDADGATFVGAEYARGVNDDSFKQDVIGVGIGRAMERFSVALLGSYISSDIDEISLGAAVALHLSNSNSPVQFSLQTGIGWLEVDGLTDDIRTLNFPIGLVIGAPPASGSGIHIRPWIMPRVDLLRMSGDDLPETDTNANLAVSGGVSLTTESGLGLHLHGDLIRDNEGFDTDYPFLFSVGVHYVL